MSCDSCCACCTRAVNSVSIARRRFVVLRRALALPSVEEILCFNRPQAIRCLATARRCKHHWDSSRVSIARRRFVVLRRSLRMICSGMDSSRFNRPQAIRCLATVGRQALTSTELNVSIARRRFVVLRLAHQVMLARGVVSFNRPQAIRCLATWTRRWCVRRTRARFNRPQAIRCLATLYLPHFLRLCQFVSIARRRFVVLRLFSTTFVGRKSAPFQSPAGDSLSCDAAATLRPAQTPHAFQSPAGDSLSCDPAVILPVNCTLLSFNRPQAIRCLATANWDSIAVAIDSVSIARRRFVVLRPANCGLRVRRRDRVSIARRRFVVLRPRDGRGAAKAGTLFQSPAGDSLSCDCQGLG